MGQSLLGFIKLLRISVEVAYHVVHFHFLAALLYYVFYKILADSLAPFRKFTEVPTGYYYALRHTDRPTDRRPHHNTVPRL